MSVATDSPSPSSSSDDLAALLDEELDRISSDPSPNDDEVDSESSDEESDDNGDATERTKRRKGDSESVVEVGSSGIVPFEQKLEVPEQDSCGHNSGEFGGMCYVCGKKKETATGIVVGYIHKSLRIGNDDITRLRNVEYKKMVQKKKLYLVIDLDHTVLNSTRLDDISPDEEYLMKETHSLQDISNGSLFRLDRIRMVTKLRPFVRKFLKEAADLFEMYIYTMGEECYAYEMASLLDPGKSYFHSRIISQGDCTQKHQKGLDVVLGMDSAVLILDDTEGVWQKHRENLIVINRYLYFQQSHSQFRLEGKSLSELKKDENEEDGLLAVILGVLRCVHAKFFDPEREDDIATRDVREVLKTVRKEVLKDCKIVFSRVFPRHCPPTENKYWNMAQMLGATLCTEVDSSVTHVVSFDTGTDKSKWALRKKKFLVTPHWIEAAHFLWERQSEDKFPVKEETKK